jgi:hypothetical protein
VRAFFRIAALSVVLVTALIAVACSSGGGDESVEATATPGAAESVSSPTPSANPTAEPATHSAVIVATPRAGATTFNDPDRDHTISGFVIDTAAGLPLRGVRVQDVDSGFDGVSDEFGFYRIDGLSPGVHNLNATGYRVESASAEVDSETWTRLDFSLSVTGDASTRRVFGVTGRITNRDSGDAITGATVSASGVDGVNAVSSAITDAFGTYDLNALPEGRYDLSVDAQTYPTFTEQMDVSGDIAWEVFLRATPSAVNGVVTGEGPDRQRIPVGASVNIVSLSGSDGTNRSVAGSQVGVDGAYALADLPPGAYRVVVTAPGYQTSEEVIALSDGSDQALDFDLKLDSASLRLILFSSTYGGVGVGNVAVIVRGVNGTPSEGVQQEVLTDSGGTAIVDNLPAGMYDVWTPSPKMVSGGDSADLYPVNKTLRLVPNESGTLNADLPAISGDVHGFVRGGDTAGQTRLGTAQRDASTSSVTDTHNPFVYLPVQLQEARITVTSARFGDLRFTPPASVVISDGFGNYVLPLPPGTYSLEASAAGYATTTKEITIGSSPATNDLRLSRATTALVGRIDGEMIQDLTHLSDAAFAVEEVSVVLQHGDNLYSGVTDSLGVFTIEDLPLTLLNGKTLRTEYEIRITHPDYLPVTDTLSLTSAEGAFRIVREFPTLAAGGFLDISINVTDKNGNKTAAIGTLESLQNIRTMDVYDSRFLVASDSVEIPNRISIRARPGQYRARICPDTPGTMGCFDHFWTSVGGNTDILVLAFNCGESLRLVRCSLDGGISATSSGNIQATGFVYSASTGEPLADANVKVELDVLSEYCSENCTGFVREFSAIGPTGPNGRFQIEFQIPGSNGGDDLVGWSWDGGDAIFTVTSPGYQGTVSTGPGGDLRLFNGTQDFYLAPSGRLSILVVGGEEEGSPVPGLDTDLGLPVTGQDNRAVVTLSPLGADLATGSNGVVMLNAPPGAASAIVNAPGHYPHSGALFVPEEGASGEVHAQFTLPVEQIPPPQIRGGTFQVTQASDGRPLMGYVIRGLSAPATRAMWEVRVDRNGVWPLRTNFEDPVEAVDLIVAVSQQCPGHSGSIPIGGTIHLRGTLLSGSASGVGTWGGAFDASDLPCGTLSWRVDARTSRSVVTSGFDWPLWPSDQRYPLSLLTNLAGPETVPVSDPVSAFIGAGLSFQADPLSLSITHEGEYLVYKIPNIVITSDFGPPAAGHLLQELSGKEHPLGSLKATVSKATLSGVSGLLDLNAITTSSDIYSLTATGLFSLDSSNTPATDNSGSWGESLVATLSDSRPNTLGLAYLPYPLRQVVDRLAVSGISGQVDEQVTANASWNLKLSPPIGAHSPVVGERRVVSGTRFETITVSEFEFATSVMSHLTVEGHLNARSVATFAEPDGSGEVQVEKTIASGSVSTTSELWSAWISTRDTSDATYFDRDAGTDSIGHTAPIGGVSAWTDRPTLELNQPGSSDGQGLIGIGGISRPSISAARSNDGKLLVSAASTSPQSVWPINTGISLLESAGDANTWSSPAPFRDQHNGMVIDTALAYGENGDAMLVWSAIPDPGDDPGAFIHGATRADLFYSRMEAGTTTWSEPKAVTGDNRPDFSPAIASDGEGRMVLTWVRDMDGNVLTSDDIVVIASEWLAGRWTVPVPVMATSGALSELSVSVKAGTAVVGLISDKPGTGRSINLSFNSLGRWSPVNVIATGRQRLTDVAVSMDKPGLATVVWSEIDGEGTDSRIIAVEATSAGVRGEKVVAADVSGFVGLSLVNVSASNHLVWVADNGSAVYTTSKSLDDWTPSSSTDVPSGRSTRFVTTPGKDGGVLTFHETINDGTPGIAIVPLTLR